MNRVFIIMVSLFGIVACTRETSQETKSRNPEYGAHPAIAKIEAPQDLKVGRVEQEIASAITDIPRVLGECDVVQFSEMLTEKISSLPGKSKQMEWCSKATNVLFNMGCGQFNPKYRYNSVWAVGYLKGQIGNCVYNAGTLEDVWYLKLQYLAWFKRQMDWCTAEYAKIEPKTRTRPIPLSVANQARALRLMGESLAVDYRAECSRYEHQFWEDRHKLLAYGSAKVQQKFEEILEHPIRTPGQIQEDHEKAVEAYRREEEAEKFKSNRPLQLVPIDGTK